MSNGLHLVIACGGTGGHFYPTISIAKEFISRGGRVTLLIAGNHAAEQLKLASEQQIPAQEVPTVRLPSGILQILSFPFKLWSCRCAARKALKALSPDIMLGMGSFASVPQCLATPSSVPIFLHEGNAFMGKANRWLLRWRKNIAGVTLSLPLANKSQLCGRPSRFVGMPLREAIVKAAEAPHESSGYLSSIGLSETKKTMLVFGGSQGARFINQVFAQTSSLLKDIASQIQIIHLTGTDDNNLLTNAYSAAGIQAAVMKSSSDIQNCFLNADVIVCRSGASSICELTLFQKPMLLIPLPSAADNHQLFNAKLLVASNAAKLCEQRHLDPPWLNGIIRNWLHAPEEWKAMGKNLAPFAHPQAAKEAVDFLLDTFRTSSLGK